MTHQFGFAAVLVALSSSMILAAGPTNTAESIHRPNILWIIVDDMSANFSCYGEKLIRTPNVDKLAAEGTRFSRAFVTAPVCSACRSALITGCYQTSIGSHHHRSGRGDLKIRLPGDVVPVPTLFKQAGYFTCIGGFGATGTKLGKTDDNFEWPREMYDGNELVRTQAGSTVLYAGPTSWWETSWPGSQPELADTDTEGTGFEH